MMRIAGKSDTNLARAIRTNEEGTLEVKLSDIKETIVRENVLVSPGQYERANIPTERPYRLFVRQLTNFGEAWELLKADEINGRPLATKARETILDSNGVDILVGNGSRGEAYSNLITPVGPRTDFYLYNRSDSDISFDVIIVEYPLGTSGGSLEGNIESNVKNKEMPLHASQSATLAPKEEVTVYTTENHSKIESFEISSNQATAQIRIETPNVDGGYTPLGSIRNNGSGVAGFSTMAIVEQGISLWRIMSYEEGNYKFALDKNVTLPTGFRVRIINSSDTEPINVACRLYGVETNV